VRGYRGTWGGARDHFALLIYLILWCETIEFSVPAAPLQRLVYTYMFMYIYIYIYVYTYVLHFCIHTYLSIYIFMRVHMYMYMHVYICICMYMHMNIHINLDSFTGCCTYTIKPFAISISILVQDGLHT